MRDLKFRHKPYYSASRALIIGIDEYQSAGPLACAVSDAKGFRDLLVSELGFAAEHVTSLFNGDATRAEIMSAYMSFAKQQIGVDERIIVFFAGHGHTESGIRGEVGYLVPYDADMQDLSTLIKWGEITGNAELVPAKHMFFIMDACYSGLAVNRVTPAGGSRFLNDMMLRYSRQVLAAGKADQPVADSGGPLPNHSVFTGHLMNGLRGAAAKNGILTANMLMSYVYGKVATDKNSNQTPHYGHFEGDGDLVFFAPDSPSSESDERKDFDTLVLVPIPEEPLSPENSQRKIHRIKSLIGDDATAIDLHDFLMEEVRRFLSASGEDYFTTADQFSLEELLDRITGYEEAVGDLSILLACLAAWARPAHRPILQKALARSTDRIVSASGLSVWLHLRWYPAIVELYCSGIAAVHGRRYDVLADIFQAPVAATDRLHDTFATAVSQAISDLNGQNVFQQLPGHELHYAPMSEYMYKALQPRLDDLMFLGSDYERAFDEFEVLFSLVVADANKQRRGDFWSLIGRFGWKHHHYNSPLSKLVEEAQLTREAWGPLASGLFGGDYERFEEVAAQSVKRVEKIGWW